MATEDVFIIANGFPPLIDIEQIRVDPTRRIKSGSDLRLIGRLAVGVILQG